MRYGKLIVAAACGALFVVGCEKKKAEPANASGTSMEHLQKSAEESAASAKETAKSETHDMASMASETKEKASTAAQSAASAVADSEIVKNAASEVQQIQTYIKDHKLDLADKALTQLEQHKSALPETIQAELPTLRKQLDALKPAAAQ